MRILIVGCGFLGEAVADRFHAAGHRVTGWTHSPESAAALAGRKPYAVEAHDITDEGDVRRARFPADVVIQCVAPGRGGGAEAYRQVYLGGARALRAEFPTARFVYTGSTSVYAQTDGGWVDEGSPAVPDRETGHVLLETERLVLSAGGSVARLAGLYGPGRSVLLKKFLAGEAVIEGDGDRWLNQIHRDDAAEALVRLVEPDAPRGLFNVADDTPLTQLAVYQGLAEHLGRPLPPFGPPDLNRKRGWTSKRVSNAWLRAATGWAPRFPSFFEAVDGLQRAED